MFKISLTSDMDLEYDGDLLLKFCTFDFISFMIFIVIKVIASLKQSFKLKANVYL